MYQRSTFLVPIYLLFGLGIFALGNHEPIMRNWDYSSTYQFGMFSTKIAVKGEIELSEDDSKIVNMSPNSTLYIREKKAPLSTELLVETNSRGKIERSLWINGVKRNSFSRENVISELLIEAARDFGIGGVAKMTRLYDAYGIERALTVIPPIVSNSAKAYLFNAFVERQSLDVSESILLIAETKEISSSSTLRELLEFLSKELSPHDVLTSELIKAVAHISSSSDAGDAVVTIARVRGLTLESAVEMTYRIKEISSNSDKRDALVFLSGFLDFDQDVMEASIAAAETISSSSDKSYALKALLKHEIHPENLEGLFRAIKSISSNADKTSVLVEISEELDLNQAGIDLYLSAVDSISSSSDKSKALHAMNIEDFSESDFTRFFESTKRISSSSDKSEVLASVAKHRDFIASAVPQYLDAAQTISSSHDKLLCLQALNAVALEEEDFEELFETARDISSSSDKKNALINILHNQDVTLANMEYYLLTAATIAGSTDKRDSILELLSYVSKRGTQFTRNSNLKQNILNTIDTISSSTDREKCLKVLIKTFV